MFPIRLAISVLLLIFTAHLSAAIKAGVGESVITPPIGTPSAGYAVRKGEGMNGEHDPLLATALYIEADKKVVFCSVDSLGFTHAMTKEIIGRVKRLPGQEKTLILIGSSHTHSGGGAFLDIPPIGEVLAGRYDPQITQFYIDKTVEAIEQAVTKTQDARVGIGYGEAYLSKYRGAWPENVKPIPEVAIIKVETEEGHPLAVLFNYPMHPTVLGADNKLFSADFVEFAREAIQESLGHEVKALYFNGAQGDIIPDIRESTFAIADKVGTALGNEVVSVWRKTVTEDTLTINSASQFYNLEPKPTPMGLKLPIKEYSSELHALVLNKKYAFVTMPGELSCLYDSALKAKGKELGLSHVSILGLVNDAHGYIITPDSWRHKTQESDLSFGGENYGDEMFERASSLLESAAR